MKGVVRIKQVVRKKHATATICCDRAKFPYKDCNDSDAVHPTWNSNWIRSSQFKAGLRIVEITSSSFG